MRFEIYRSDDQFGWRLIASNGNIVAIGGELYHNLGDVGSVLRSIFGLSSIMRSIEVEKALIEYRKEHPHANRTDTPKTG